MKFTPSPQQEKVFAFDKQKLVVSASAGAGKTTTMIELIASLIEKGASVKRMLILTFTKAAAAELKERLGERLLQDVENPRIQDQLDELLISDISTIHSFLEKLIKRNISHLPELESFAVLDENQTSKIMEEAFIEAVEVFKKESPKGFEELFFTIRENKSIKQIIFALHAFFSAQAGREEKLKEFSQNFDKFFEESCKILNDEIISQAGEILRKIEDFYCDNQKVKTYLDEIYNVFKGVNSDSLLENLQYLNQHSISRQPVLRGYEKLSDIVEIKEAALSLLKLPAKYNLAEKGIWSGEQTKSITIEIYKLQQIFERIFKARKMDLNVLDFNDLEWQSELILENPVLLDDVQQAYDFVFIDEYQDTNPVQEKLVKAISEKGRFVAVGDPKQGIYAFRNATAKIILADSANFAGKPESDTLYLTENYRSDVKILNFVNSVFSKVMTEKSSGIDYLKTSMLKGKLENLETKLPAVRIDIAKKSKPQKREWVEGYRIFDDPLTSEDSAIKEAKIVALRVEEFLTHEIFDSKLNAYRKVAPSDIAILTRSRSDVSDAVMNELRERKLPFVSTLRSDITEKTHIKLILSLLSLCVNFHDDISLAAFLLSPFVRLSVDELAILRKDDKAPLWQMVQNSTDDKIKNARNRFLLFKKQTCFYGAKRALENLFNETDFYSYLLNELGENGAKDVDALLYAIAGFENDKSVPDLLSYLESGVAIASSASSDAITISSIHASKGLEYPIVILIGTGKPMIKPDPSSFKINSTLGLALSYYDTENFQKFASPMLLAERLMARKSERIDELMILYVALTRAKSHLVITGTFDSEKAQLFDGGIEKFSSVLSLLLATQEGALVSEIDQVESFEVEKVAAATREVNLEVVKKLEDYLNFSYPFKDETQIKQKVSVTELSASGEDFSNANPIFSQTGTAYHEALRLLDFENVFSVDDVKNQIISKKFGENMQKLVDFNLIFENIKLIKPLVENKKIFKEKPFVLKLENNQLVQGVVDLFAVGDENILIDYKFTRENNEKILKNRYQSQLELYKQAIEKAENITIDKIYLLSLLNKKKIIY